MKSTGNAGGSPKYPPIVSTTNIIVSAGTSKLETLVSEIQKGIILNRFSGTVNPIDGDFSGVVKGGYFVKNGNIICPVKELMVAGNIFEALKNLTGVSKETKSLPDSILPHTRFSNYLSPLTKGNFRFMRLNKSYCTTTSWKIYY